MQRQLDKLEKDTYKVRKAEGRPKHGQTSFAILGMGAISWLMLAVAIAMPEWRSNWIGVLGYTSPRSWGLFQVSGMTVKFHTEVYSDACRYSSQLTVGGICASPICLWYRKKCMVYMTLAYSSFTTAFFLIICLILHTLCLIWTMRMTPRMIRWATIWWCGQCVIHMSVIAFWMFMTMEAFSDLDTESIYPEPAPSSCFYAECLVIMILCAICVLSITLMKMWPEESSGSGSSDSDDDDEDEDDYGYGGGQGWKGGKGPPPGMKGGPPMMDKGGFKGGPPMDYGKGGFGPPPGGMGPPPGAQF